MSLLVRYRILHLHFQQLCGTIALEETPNPGRQPERLP